MIHQMAACAVAVLIASSLTEVPRKVYPTNLHFSSNSSSEITAIYQMHTC